MRARFERTSAQIPVHAPIGRLVAALTLVLSAGSALAAANQGVPQVRAGVLNLRAGDIDTATLENLLDAPAFPGDPRVMLEVDAPLTPQGRVQLAASGVELHDYLNTNVFVADVSRAAPAQVRALGLVRRAFRVDAEWKIDESLITGAVPVYEGAELRAITGADRTPLMLSLFSSLTAEQRAAAVEAIRAVPGVVDATEPEYAAGDLTLAVTLGNPARNAAENIDMLNAVLALAEIPAVQSVDPWPELLPRLSTVRGLVQSGDVNVTPLYAHGLTGLDHIIGIVDSAIDYNHCAFFDPLAPVGPTHRKIVSYNTNLGIATHGTHVAGIAAGDAGAFDDNRGVAYNARIAYNAVPTSLNEAQIYGRWETNRLEGAFVQNNSWGNNNTTAYDVTARAADNFMWTNQESLLVVAAANQPLIRNPENAKNSLAVFATGDVGNEEFWASGGRGPTTDQRRKPEVGAPGQLIAAPWANQGCETITQTGTSMATPAVSAIALLTREYFIKGFYPSGSATPSDTMIPSGALLRAMSINSGVDMTGIAGYPSTQEGWGRIIADGTLYFTGDSRRLLVRDVYTNTSAALAAQQVAYVRVAVPAEWAASNVLHATMTFTDAPGSVLSSAPVVNNLNLVLHAPDGSRYLGNNVIDGVSLSVAGGGTTADAINNAEQVILPTAQPGVWVVEIRGANVATPQPQGYGLVLTGPVREVTCLADLNLDSFVDDTDFASFAQAYDAFQDVRGDFNADGFTDDTDFVIFAQSYEEFTCP